MKNKKIELRQMVFLSMFAAVTIILATIPQVGMISIGPITLTTLHIPVLLGVVILKPKFSLALGVIFGLASMTIAFTRAVSPFDLAFRNPLVSVLPRALFGVGVWGVFHGFNKLNKTMLGKMIIFLIVISLVSVATFNTLYPFLRFWEINNAMLVTSVTVMLIALILLITIYLSSKKNEGVYAVASTFVVGTLIHTILVLFAMLIFARGPLIETFGEEFMGVAFMVFVANGVLEALAAIIIAVPIYIAIQYINNDEEEKKKV